MLIVYLFIYVKGCSIVQKIVIEIGRCGFIVQKIVIEN